MLEKKVVINIISVCVKKNAIFIQKIIKAPDT